MTDQDHLDRINALTANARTTWFALLAALAFVGITLMGVKHIDFYGADRATALPVVNVEVPTRFFFVAAPILVTAIYGYFHLYLIRLWDALGAAPARLNGIRLGDAITPWLVSDAALHFRCRLRRDNAATPRALEGGAMLLNFLLAWGFGLIILFFTWQLSMPARSFWMTGIAAAAFGVSIIAGASSMAMMARRMRKPPDADPPTLWATWVQAFGLAIGVAALLWFSHQKTQGSSDHLAPLNLLGEEIVERPAGWLSYDDARAEFRAMWCRRESVGNCSDLGPREAEFAAEFDRRRGSEIADLRRAGWIRFNTTGLNLRRAELSYSFLVGAHLWQANLQEASLLWSDLERAYLAEANFAGADMRYMQLYGANLSFSQMASGANPLSGSLFGTDLRSTANHGGMLRSVDMRGVLFNAATDFRNSFLDGSVLVTQEFRTHMGDPCQWVKGRLDDLEFYGRWRGWIEAMPEWMIKVQWDEIAPDAFRDITAIAPPEGCEWQYETSE
ncbi:pentapeptide repeat-containing protein [Roseobacter denitrificans]|uniref:Pentapeptide repeat family protein n=1 Tax=Roseobacter denitrificans (strain ATCC 33942 / OCh 114) TaxID=375451 RepID=Q164W9_ROSDO|nr:pentapeptide repeat-containing protein [Roseobacter denitrificans]ABG32474.1 hypothetical protein RD1_2953 [Roseobacter denitrificans OCh 114]AVL51931.1 pentapeptide repeat-containing protein [Roseobacter denitrificans]SFF82282.1 Uncharacterized protein YjbI, contains pentapeptide repeats [Roseobacter denitrificans OCh 114]